MLQNKYGYVYKTTDLTNKRVYVGQHRGEFDSGYKGSGLLIVRAINKRGEKKFKTELLAYAETREELDELEKDFIKSYMRMLSKRKMYNIKEGGSTCALPLSIRKRISRKLKGRYAGDKNPFFGKHHSKEVRKKISDKVGGRVGELNGNWKGGVCLVKYYCDCGKQICKESRGCKSCAGKRRPRSQFVRMAKLRGAPWNKGLKTSNK